MANIQTGEVRRWDSLTKAQQESGQWIRLPDGSEGGAARPRTFIDDMPMRNLEDDLAGLRSLLSVRRDTQKASEK